MQHKRSTNPNVAADITIVNVELADGEDFDEKKALDGCYTFQILGGQHINICDWELLGSVYHGKPSDKIPQHVWWKTCEVYQNLTSAERSLFVYAANAKFFLEHSFFEKVRACSSSRIARTHM